MIALVIGRGLLHQSPKTLGSTSFFAPFTRIAAARVNEKFTMTGVIVFATWDGDFIHCGAAKTSLSQRRNNARRAAAVRYEDTQMLFIFNNKNSIEIAWGSKLSARNRDSRTHQLDTRFGTIGFIRSWSAG
jgi:hypothetical protein